MDGFGVKYVNKEDVDHLIASIKTTYSLTKDWTGNLYCGIALEWDYKNGHIDISMPGYQEKIAGIWAYHAQAITAVSVLT